MILDSQTYLGRTASSLCREEVGLLAELPDYFVNLFRGWTVDIEREFARHETTPKLIENVRAIRHELADLSLLDADGGARLEKVEEKLHDVLRLDSTAAIGRLVKKRPQTRLSVNLRGEPSESIRVLALRRDSLLLACETIDNSHRACLDVAPEVGNICTVKSGRGGQSGATSRDSPSALALLIEGSNREHVVTALRELPVDQRRILLEAFQEAEKRDFHEFIYGTLDVKATPRGLNRWLKGHAGDGFKGHDKSFVVKAIQRYCAEFKLSLVFLADDGSEIPCNLTTAKQRDDYPRRFFLRESGGKRRHIASRNQLPELRAELL
jgi:hypothetical protein